jgi:hypothetical protein
MEHKQIDKKNNWHKEPSNMVLIRGTVILLKNIFLEVD